MSFASFDPVSFDRIEPLLSVHAALERLTLRCLGTSARIRLSQDPEGNLVKDVPSRDVVQKHLALLDMLFHRLRSGSLSSYVEDRGRERFFRVPDCYWNGRTALGSAGAAFEPLDLPGYTGGMAGQPVLVSAADIDALVASIPSTEAKFTSQAPPPGLAANDAGVGAVSSPEASRKNFKTNARHGPKIDAEWGRKVYAYCEKIGRSNVEKTEWSMRDFLTDVKTFYGLKQEDKPRDGRRTGVWRQKWLDKKAGIES